MSFSSIPVDGRDLPGVLLEMFSGQCSSVGNYTNNAINVGNALISSFKKLMEDPKCSSSQGLIDSMSTFQSRLNDLNSDSSEYQVIELERRIEELTMSLNTVTDVGLLSQIAAQLASARLQLISAKSFYETNSSVRSGNRKNSGYYYAAYSLRQMFQKLPDIQFCSDNYSILANQIISNSLNVASYFVNPGLSAAMSGVAVLTNAAIDAIREVVRNRRLAKLNEIMLPTALSCSAEVLTNRYCENLRAETVIKKYSEYEETNNQVWRGIPFIFRKLGPLLEWMEYVRAGSPASDNFDSERRIEVLRNEGILKELKQRIDGKISTTDLEIPNLGSNLDSFILTKIGELVSLLMSSPTVSTLNSYGRISFRLIGFGDIPSCDYQGRISPCGSLQEFRLYYSNGTTKPGYTFSLADWIKAKENYGIIYREAVNFVNSQLTRVVNEDQEIVMARAFEGYHGKESPYVILGDLLLYLKEISEYLIKNNSDGKYNPQIQNIESSRITFNEVWNYLNQWKNSTYTSSPNSPNELNNRASEVLGKIYEKLNLNTGDRFFLERIRAAIRWDIIARMNNGEFDRELMEIIRLNNQNVISDITAYKLFNLQDMINDIANSKGILKITLKTFFDLTKNHFLRALELIEANNLDASLKEKICVHLLATDFFLDKKTGLKFYNYCKGTRFNSIFQNANLSIIFDNHVNLQREFSTKFEDRVCLFNRFMREVNIREHVKDY